MVKLIVKNNIKKAVSELDKEKQVGNIAGDVAPELEKKIEEILSHGSKRAKANNRRTLYARDL